MGHSDNDDDKHAQKALTTETVGLLTFWVAGVNVCSPTRSGHYWTKRAASEKGRLQTFIVHGMLSSMAVISRTVATLRIVGDDLDPNEVTRLLGIEPTAQTRKGEPSRSGYPARQGIWRLSATEQAPGDLNRQIDELLAKVTSDPSVWAHLTQKFRCDIFCGLFMKDGNEGEQLEPGTLAMLGSRGLQLGLDIYGAGD